MVVVSGHQQLCRRLQDILPRVFGLLGSIRPDYIKYLMDFDRHYSVFKDFCAHVKSAGVFFLDTSLTHCLMVKEKTSGKYGVPKGKCLPKEIPYNCMKREFMEEVGFDCVEHGAAQLLTSLFLGRELVFFVLHSDMTSDSTFVSSSPEIERVEWVPIAELGVGKKRKFNVSASNLLLIKLRKWIERRIVVVAK